MIDLSLRWQPTFGGDRVTQGCDVRRYEDPMEPGKPYFCFESYVEIELSANLNVCWWFEVKSFPEKWVIERRLLRSYPGGQDVLKELSDREFSDTETLVKEAKSVLEELVAISPVDAQRL